MIRLLRNASAFMIGLILIFAFVLSYASDKPKMGSKGPNIDQVINSNNTRNYDIDKRISNDSASESSAKAEASANSGSSSESAASNGDMTSITKNQFMAYGQSDRPASGCFASGDAAGAEGGKFGALGFYWLDNNCWANELAEAEDNIYLNARLRCDSTRYRRAIAYDVPGRWGKKRREACIERVSEVSLARLELQTAEIQKMIDSSVDESEAKQSDALGEVRDEMIERDARIHESGQKK